MQGESTTHTVEFDCGELHLRGVRISPAASIGEVLLLHGAGQTRHSWGGAMRHLAQVGWSATAIDLRGHGDSDWSNSAAYSLEANAADVAHVVAAIAEPVVLVGASLGGLASLLAAATHRDNVRGLVLVDIAPRTSTDGVRRIHDFMLAHTRGFATLDDVAAAIGEYKGADRPTNATGLRKVVRQHDDGRWYWHWDPQLLSTHQRIAADQSQRADTLLQMAARVHVPTLVVRGTESDVIDQDSVDELRQALPYSFETGVTAGHMVAGDDNDAFTTALTDFLQRLHP